MNLCLTIWYSSFQSGFDNLPWVPEINTIDFKPLLFFGMLFCWCRAGPGPQAATSGENRRRCRTSTWSYSEICDLNSRLHMPPQISDTFAGENDGHFFGHRHVETLYFAGVDQGRFNPPTKNTRTAVGLFSKNQSYLEMIHPPMNWHSYGNPWVSS